MITNIKIGIGYDIHRLVPNKKLILGGVTIPFDKGLDGHSDADVILHAICDAMLGALAKGDIGEHFSDTDEQYKGISSLILLEKVNGIVKGAGFKIGNIDTMVLAEAPLLKEFKPKMREIIAQTLAISEDQVSVKATTREGIGFPGGQEAIAAYANVLLLKA